MSSSFTVLPMSQRFYLEPGKTYTESLSITNPADASEDFVYNVSVSPYSVTGEGYAADLATMTNQTEITKWIKVLEPSGRVKPNESKEIKFTITVPENAPAGGQYATIAVSSSGNNASTGGVAVENVFELASLVYATVAGETVYGGEIIENSVPAFATSVPITLSALISNTGNLHEDATFLISVSNAFTGEVILPTEENDGRFNELIMPETTREVKRAVDDLPALGVVTVSQKIYYRGELSEVTRNIIICPIWFMILVCLTLCAIITTIVGIVLKHKKKKRRLKEI